MTTAAPDHIISNSADWKDVYSTTIYANLQGVAADFLTSTRHSTMLLYSIPTSKKEIEVISSEDNPFVIGYKSIIEAKGYETVNEFTYDDVNLELAERLDDITKFIIIDYSYGYNSISVAPYAVLDNYYVLFADERNINRVMNFLDDRTVDDIIIYGQVDREVKDALTPYDPEIINTGDRFDNNIEIVKKYQQRYEELQGNVNKQTLLSNGEFIEASLVDGVNPVVFIGFSNVPDQVREYIQSSDLEVGILVGNELIGTATFVRRQTGLSVFVKFARGSRVPTGGISPVEDLDRFPIPRYSLDLSIYSLQYNQATEELEVTHKNNVDIATYYKSTITINDGGELKVVGDEDALFVGPSDFKSVSYEVTLNSDNISGSVYTIYGESPRSLEKVVEGTFTIEIVSVMDEAEINITGVVYDKARGRFLITIKNVGEVDAYVQAEVIELWINGEYITINSDEVIKLEPGESKDIAIDADLTDEDIERNDIVKVRAYYGERETALIKSKYAEYEFKTKGVNLTIYVLVLVVIILLIIFFVRRKCKHCKYKNPIIRRTCKRCGQKL
jgi:archaellum component FlaF (FlaF/FlaG flagellin family)